MPCKSVADCVRPFCVKWARVLFNPFGKIVCFGAAVARPRGATTVNGKGERERERGEGMERGKRGEGRERGERGRGSSLGVILAHLDGIRYFGIFSRFYLYCIYTGVLL